MSWLPVTVTVEPASEPVTAAEAKAQARITATNEDAVIASYIKAARQMVEEYTGARLVTQTVDFRGDSFDLMASLPIAPVQSITSVKYLDSSGAEQTLSTDVYGTVLNGLSATIRLKYGQSWPTPWTAPDAVRVVAVVGYTTVPEAIRQAIVLQVASWFADREIGKLSEGTLLLLENYRRHS